MTSTATEIFVTNFRRDRVRFAVAIALILLGIFLIGLPRLLPPLREASWVDSLIIPGVLLLFIVIPFLLVVIPRAFFHQPQRLEIDANGLVITKGKRTARYLWNDITTCDVIEKDPGEEVGSIAGAQMGGSAGGFVGGVLAFYLSRWFGDMLGGKVDTRNTTTITLKTSDGQRYMLDRRLSPWLPLLERLPAAVTQAWSQQYIERLNHHQSVDVRDPQGKLVATLTADTIANHETPVAWTLITSLTYEVGKLALRTDQPGVYLLRFNVDGNSVQGKALVETIRAKSPAVREAQARKQQLKDKPLWNPRSSDET